MPIVMSGWVIDEWHEVRGTGADGQEAFFDGLMSELTVEEDEVWTAYAGVGAKLELRQDGEWFVKGWKPAKQQDEMGTNQASLFD